MKKKILVTGSSGFIGSFLVEGGLERGFQVWAGVRKRSSRKYLQDSRIQFAELDFTDSTHLEEQLKQHRMQHGGWDYIIHCAGVTKCLDKADFEMGNYWATRLFIETLQRLNMVPERFLYLSSLSVFGPIHEKNYQSITETDVPKPDTAYGLSKLHTEEYLASLKDFPYVIFRPTGVYGPRGLFPDGKVYPESCGFHGRFPAAGPDFCLCERPGAGYLPGYRQTGDTSVLFCNGWRCIQQPYVFRPDTEGIGKSLDVPFHLSVVVAESDFVCFGKRREIASQAEYAELRQIQNHEAAQLAVRHYTAGKGIGILSGVFVGERSQRNNCLV